MMKRSWTIAGTSLVVGLGFGMSATRGAFEPPDKKAPPPPAGDVSAAQTGTSTTNTEFVEIEPLRAVDSRIPDYVESGPADTVRVYTMNANAPPAFEDRGFHLVLTC